MTHGRPTIEELAALASGELPPAAAGAIEAAAAHHGETATTLAHLREIVEALRSDDGEAPPPSAVARTKATLAALRQRSAPAAPGRWWEAVRDAVERMAARLVFDSAQPGHALGFRDAAAMAGGELAATRHLAFERDGVEIDLQFECGTFDGHASRCQVIGQISRQVGGQDCRTEVDGCACASLPVALVSIDGAAVVEIATDAAGIFVLSVEPGRYDLIVGGPDALVLPGIQVP